MLAQAVMLLVYWECNQVESQFGHPLIWCGVYQSLQMVGGGAAHIMAQPLPYVCCAIWPQLLTVSLNEQIKTCRTFSWTL